MEFMRIRVFSVIHSFIQWIQSSWLMKLQIIFVTLLILRLTAVCPVALTGSMENLPDGSSSLMLKMELMPVSVSLISMSRLARGVPIGAFSRMLTLYSGLLKVGVSSLTSLIVMVISAVELVSVSTPRNR